MLKSLDLKLSLESDDPINDDAAVMDNPDDGSTNTDTTSDDPIDEGIDEEVDELLEDEGDDTVADDVSADTVDDEVDEAAEKEIRAIEAMSNDIVAMSRLYAGIEEFGLTPGMLKVIPRSDLLSTTILGMPSYETLQSGSVEKGSEAAKAAMEGVVDAVKEKLSDWAGRVGKFFSGMARAVFSGVRKATDWFTRAISAITNSKSEAPATEGAKWDKTVAFVKAHPWVTVSLLFTGLSPLTAILAAVALAKNSKAAEAALEQITGRKNQTGTENLAAGGKALIALTGKLPAPVRGTAAKLGWNKETILKALNGAKDGLIKLANSVKDFVAKMLKNIQTWATEGGLGNAIRAVGRVIRTVWTTVKTAIGNVWRAVTGSTKAAAKTVAPDAAKKMGNTPSTIIDMKPGPDGSWVAV